MLGTGKYRKVAQSVKYLPCKQEDPNSIPRMNGKKKKIQGVVALTCNPSIEEINRSLKLPSQSACSPWRASDGPRLRNDIQGCPQACTYTHTQVLESHTHTHSHSHTKHAHSKYT